MSSGEESEGIRTKVLLLIADKLLLAGLAIGVAYFLNVNLQEQGKVFDYQKSLFDHRMDAYLEVLQKARIAKDELALWDSREESGWMARLSTLEDRWEKLSGTSSFGSSGDLTTLDQVIPALKDIEDAWRSKSVYFSKPVSDAVGEFLVPCIPIWRHSLRSSNNEEKREIWETRKPSPISMTRVLGSARSRLIKD